MKEHCAYSGNQNLLHPDIAFLFSTTEYMHVIRLVFKEREIFGGFDGKCKGSR